MSEAASSHAPWWLYILLCDNKTYYTGVTTDVERRFREHVEGAQKGAKYTKSCHRFELVYSIQVGTRSEAQKLEYQVKKLPRQKKEFIIRGALSAKSLMRILKKGS